jgi:hypothetical protein
VALSAATLWVSSQRLIALAVLLQSLEWLRVREVFADTGVWRFAVLEPELRTLPQPLRMLSLGTLRYRAFVALLCVRVAAALLLMAAGVSWLLPLLCVSQLLVCIRFRGASNGGSDAMSLVALIALSAAVCCGDSPFARHAALLYVAVQVTLSYVIAGLAKLRQPDWRSGLALRHFLSVSAYGAPCWCAHQTLARAASWLVIAFECGFVLAWLSPSWCLGWLGCGLGFHVVNAYLFGLNRFVFAWLAGYPAVLYCAGWLAQGLR